MKVRNNQTNIVEDVADPSDLKTGILSGSMTPLETGRSYYLRDGNDLYQMPNHEKWIQAHQENPETTPLLDIDVEIERRKASDEDQGLIYNFAQGIVNGFPFAKAIKNKIYDTLIDADIPLDPSGIAKDTTGLTKEQIKTKMKEMAEAEASDSPISYTLGNIAGTLASIPLAGGATSKAIPIISKLLPSSVAIPAYVAAKQAPKLVKVAAEGAAYSTLFEASDVAEETTRTDSILPTIASHFTADTLAEIGIGAGVNVALFVLGKGLQKAGQELIPGMGPTGKDTIGNKVASWAAFRGKEKEVDKELYRNVLKKATSAEQFPTKGEARNYDEWRENIKTKLSDEGIWNPNTERSYMIGEGPAKYKEMVEGIIKKVESPIGTATDKELNQANKLFDKVFNNNLLREYESDPLVKQKLDTFFSIFKQQETIDDQINILKQMIDEGGVSKLGEGWIEKLANKFGINSLVRGGVSSLGIGFLTGGGLSLGIPTYLATAPIHSPEAYLKFLSKTNSVMESQLVQGLKAGSKTPIKMLKNDAIYELANAFKDARTYDKYLDGLQSKIDVTEEALQANEDSPVNKEWNNVLNKMDEPTRDSIVQKRLEAITYLSEMAPKNKILGNGRVVSPSTKDLIDYSKRVYAVSNPSYLFNKIQTNTKLDSIEREVLERFHPTVYQLWIEAQGSNIKLGDVQANEKVSYTLNGKNTVSSPAFQEIWKAPSLEQAIQPPSKNTPISNSVKTDTQKILERN